MPAGGEREPLIASGPRGLTIENSPCCTVGNSWFVNASEHDDDNQRGIFCTYAGGDPPGVLACVFFPNNFTNVKTAIEIDGSVVSAARDCVVFPQFIGSSIGAMMLPTNVTNSGLVVLGGRASPSATRGIALPAMPTAGLPTLGAGDAGYMLYDPTEGRLVYWDGTTWRPVATI